MKAFQFCFFAVLLIGVPVYVAAEISKHVTGCVVLLHGLGRTSDSMDLLAKAAASAGYRVANIDYPSREYRIEQLAPRAVGEGVRTCNTAVAEPLHFVTHSMGGLLVRYYAKFIGLPAQSRVVMLSPPNRGSEVADQLSDWSPYRWFNGPAGQQLVTDPDGLPTALGPVGFPLGVITGNRHAVFDSWMADLIPGEDDGKVSVERAKVDGMQDFLVLPYAHPFIMREPEVIEQTLHFLAHGRFDRSENTTTALPRN